MAEEFLSGAGDKASSRTLLNDAIDRHQRGELSEAQRLYERILAEQPNSAHALHLLGVIAHQQADHPAALELIGRAIAIAPERSEYFNNYGAALIALGRHAEALACFYRAISLNEKYVDAISNLGLAFDGLGNTQRAKDIYEQLLANHAQHVPTLERLGKLLRRLGQLRSAEESLQRALAIAPNRADLYNELGCLLLSDNRAVEALDAYRQSLALDPNYAPAAFNLGCAYAEQELTNAARDAFAMAARLRPEKAAWQLRAVAICPAMFESAEDISHYLTTLDARLDELSQRKLFLPLEDVADSNLFPPFGLSYLGRNVLPIKRKYASLFPSPSAPFPRQVRLGRKRIGFVVTERHQGIFLRCMAGIVEQLDRTRFQPVVLCSQSAMGDIQAGLNCSNCEYVSFPADLQTALDMVRQAKCDLLYYWEVGSDVLNYHLASARLAPVQCTSWGSQLSTGVPNVDYFLSSSLIEDEAAQRLYSERLWLATTMPTCQRRLPKPSSVDRAHFGLPAKGSLYVCAQNPLKLHPDFDPLVARILRADKKGRVVFKEGRYPHTAQKLRERFARTMPDVADRIIFLPWLALPDYYRVLNLATVILDPLYFGAGSTAYDAFSFNLPVVTLPGESIVGRVTAACYRRMGIDGAIAESADDYLNTALYLAQDRDARTALRNRIEQQSQVLFEDSLAVREHERFFAAALELAN